MPPEGENHRGPVPPALTFARVPKGKTVKNRLHLDVNPTDREQDEEVRRLLDLGARHADVGQTGDEGWVCLADPEGNEFCASLRAVANDRRLPSRAGGSAAGRHHAAGTTDEVGGQTVKGVPAGRAPSTDTSAFMGPCAGPLALSSLTQHFGVAA
jgi:glyoxalase superfamily protein